MRIGVVFPQTEIGADAGAIRAYAEGMQHLGFTHVLVYDHVIGADPAIHAPWTGPSLDGVDGHLATLAEAAETLEVAR